MPVNPCPSCRYLNAPQAKRCAACGAELGAWDTLPPPVLTFTKIDTGGALWLDDLRQPSAEPLPIDVPIEESTSLTLREIEWARAPTPEPPLPAAWESTGDADPAPAQVSDEPAGRAVSATPVDEAAARAERKAAKRAQVRRARLKDAAAASESASVTPEVLVLAAEDASREHLCALLRAFGFGVHAVAKPSVLTEPRPIVAVFVDIAIDITGGGDGIDLCQQIRAADRRRGGPAAVLVLVAERLRTIDHVRAKLAGCDDTLLKPVTRGRVASVLDARGVALPSDARRH